jgi:hypothetical protein
MSLQPHEILKEKLALVQGVHSVTEYAARKLDLAVYV